MAYISTNLYTGFDSGSPNQTWTYLTTDSFATVCGSGYINDGYIQGMQPGDIINVLTFTSVSNGNWSGFLGAYVGAISSVTAYGAATVAPGGDPRLVGLSPNVLHDADYTLVASDAGGSLGHDTASANSWTVPANVFSAGQVIRISTGQSSGTLSILAGSGLTLNRVDGTAGTGTRTLAAASSAVLYFKSPTVAEISGVFAS